MERCNCSEEGRGVIVTEDENGEYVYICNNCGNLIDKNDERQSRVKRGK